MKIIKKGELPLEPVYHFSCSHCGCYWEAQQSETFMSEGGYDSWPVRCCQCPTCGKQTPRFE